MMPQQLQDLKWLVSQRQWKAYEALLEEHRASLFNSLENLGSDEGTAMAIHHFARFRKLATIAVKEFDYDQKEKIRNEK